MTQIYVYADENNLEGILNFKQHDNQHMGIIAIVICSSRDS